MRSELLSRWLYNVNIVKSWDKNGRQRGPLPWWLPPSINSQHQTQTNGASTGGAQLPNANGDVDNPFQLGPFIGQGRKLQACFLASVLMEVGDGLRQDQRRNPGEYNTSAPYDRGAWEVFNRLSARPPSSWYKIAFISHLLVWTSITMALLLAYNSPSIGLGCWSGSFLLFGVLSNLTWMLQFIRPQRPVVGVRKICAFFNLVSLGWLIAVIFLMVSPKCRDW